MTNALTNTGMGGSRVSKGEVKGYFYVNPNIPLLMGDGIKLEYFDLGTGQLVDPVKVHWDSSRIGIKFSTDGYSGDVVTSSGTMTVVNGIITTVA